MGRFITIEAQYKHMPDLPKDLPAGYTITEDDELVIPYKLENEEEFREIMSRESIFSFSSAALGTAVAGPAGTVAGHIAGTTAGIIRHKKIHPDDELTESELPAVVADD